MQVEIKFDVTYTTVIEVDDDEFKDWKDETHPGERRTNDMVRDYIEEQDEYYRDIDEEPDSSDLREAKVVK